jgi:hypothetical protein
VGGIIDAPPGVVNVLTNSLQWACIVDSDKYSKDCVSKNDPVEVL